MDARGCSWEDPHVTLGDVKGNGTCVIREGFNVTLTPYHDICNHTISIPSASGFEYILRSPRGTWFACMKDITPCVSSTKFSSICILVHILPQIYLFRGTEGRAHLLGTRRSHRAVPILIPLLVGLGFAGSAAIGTAGLITSHQNLRNLEVLIDADLRHLTASITTLQDQVDSLAEMVLQNRRGLDLLFSKERGLCAALGETSCFYASKSGVVRDSLALVRKNIEEREKNRQASESWYQRMYTWSPWMTALLSALAGPAILLFLGLLVGPCILNALVKFVKQKISEIKILALRRTYAHLDTDETESRI